MAVNARQERSIPSLFVDDVLALAKSMHDLQTFLNDAQQWADDFDMVWNISKSCGLCLPSRPLIKGEHLPHKEREVYLCIRLTKSRLGDNKLLSGMNVARGMLFKMRRMTERWNMSLAQRRMMVEGFVFSITDYLLFLHPITSEVTDKSRDLHSRCLHLILNTKVSPSARCRGRSIVRIIYVQGRREKDRIQTIARIQSRACQTSATLKDGKMWQIMARYAKIAPTIRKTDLPSDGQQLDTWRKFQIRVITENDWRMSANFRRYLPEGAKLPPALRGALSWTLERLVVAWYLNKITGNIAPSRHKDELNLFLSLTFLNADQRERLELWLYEVEKERQKTAANTRT